MAGAVSGPAPLPTNGPRRTWGGSGASGAVGGLAALRGPPVAGAGSDATASVEGGAARGGMPQAKAGGPAARLAESADPVGIGLARGGTERGPLVRTRIAPPSKATSTAPCVSVRYVRPASSPSRSIVAGAGCP